MNINDTSLLTSILVSFLLLVVEAPLAGCLPALCQETSVIFLPILFTQWLFFFFFASISRVWNDNEGEKKKENGPTDAKALPRCAVESDGFRCSLIPAVGLIQVDWFPCNTFLRRQTKEELLDEDWDVFSIPGRICRNPLLSNALLEMRKKVEHPSFYISEDGRLGWNSGLRTTLVIQSQHHQFPHLCCKLDYLSLFSLQSIGQMATAASKAPLLKQKIYNKAECLQITNSSSSHLNPSKLTKLCSAKEIFCLHPLSEEGFPSDFLFLWRRA